MTPSTPSGIPLSGVRIWLSGSVDKDSDEAARLIAFVNTLAQTTFSEGGRILHGFHPSLTPTLLDAARTYKTVTGRMAPLSLFVSTHYRQNGRYDRQLVADIEDVCELQQIPKAPDVDQSLALLRDALASQSDALVAVGGKWWTSAKDKAGVPAEFTLALARGIPSFLLGGLGGATAGYLASHPEILRNLRNGLDETANRALASETNIEALAGQILQQVARLPLGRRETAAGQRFRILCLDGGGIRGAFTAAVLARWEELANDRVADHFDLIAGTSTGGILAIGLGLGMRAQEIVDFYRKQGPDIFPVTGLATKIYRGIRRVSSAKYDAADLEASLKVAYDREGKRAFLRDSKQRLVITSYNLTANDLTLYRTSHHPDVHGHDALAAVVVARATSAAPTYFKTAKVEEDLAPHEAVDGGVWANCPALPALGEAVNVLKIPLDRIDLLSIGTAGLPTLVEDPELQGMAGWGPKAPDLLMNAQMDATLQHMKQLLGARFVRVDDDRPRVESMDDLEKLDYLIARGAKVGSDSWGVASARFVNGVHAKAWREI